MIIETMYGYDHLSFDSNAKSAVVKRLTRLTSDSVPIIRLLLAQPYEVTTFLPAIVV